MTALEILEQLMENLRAAPNCVCHHALSDCSTREAIDEALYEAEDNLQRARLITREITEAS